jgi:hypothetical protein
MTGLAHVSLFLLKSLGYIPRHRISSVVSHGLLFLSLCTLREHQASEDHGHEVEGNRPCRALGSARSRPSGHGGVCGIALYLRACSRRPGAKGKTPGYLKKEKKKGRPGASAKDVEEGGSSSAVGEAAWLSRRGGLWKDIRATFTFRESWPRTDARCLEAARSPRPHHHSTRMSAIRRCCHPQPQLYPIFNALDMGEQYASS